MKPAPQISPSQPASRNFPLTDYSFQATVDAKSGSSPVVPAKKAPAFHKLSSEFFGAETSRDYFAELLFFILIAGIAAWPIISAIVAIIRLIRNY
ncbi:MAG TPA: hypothetical protein VNN16_00325 [Candidatus Sulfotelmatobacter sp.]|nr:hypothetical protein [Candidatus Sulfotelmatobacter sp.]